MAPPVIDDYVTWQFRVNSGIALIASTNDTNISGALVDRIISVISLGVGKKADP